MSELFQGLHMANYTLLTLLNIYLIRMMRMVYPKKEVKKWFGNNLFYTRDDQVTI